MSLEVVRERCAGADVHKRTVVVHVITPETRQTRTFGTMTDELCALGDLLMEHWVVDVAMESTGVYWKPLYNLLEALGLRPVVANARHIKGVPGRKTDVGEGAGARGVPDPDGARRREHQAGVGGHQRAGVSGRQMLRQISAGCDDPEALAGLARGPLQHKHASLVRALRRNLGPHRRHSPSRIRS